MNKHRGRIFAEEAYALGKMLDHSGWQNLPRKITPSDFDMIFDNDGAILFCELSSSSSEWKKLSAGQRWAYQSAIRYRVRWFPCLAVLCRHNLNPETGRKIDTMNDVIAFQVMLHDFDFRVSRLIKGNEHWQKFVTAWFSNSSGLFGEILQRSSPL